MAGRGRTCGPGELCVDAQDAGGAGAGAGVRLVCGMGAIAKAGPESEKRDATEELVVGGVCCCCCEDVEEREEVDPSDGRRGGLVVQSDGTCRRRCCRDTGGGGSGISRWSVACTCRKWIFRWCGMMAVKKRQVTPGT